MSSLAQSVTKADGAEAHYVRSYRLLRHSECTCSCKHELWHIQRIAVQKSRPVRQNLLAVSFCDCLRSTKAVNEPAEHKHIAPLRANVQQQSGCPECQSNPSLSQRSGLWRKADMRLKPQSRKQSDSRATSTISTPPATPLSSAVQLFAQCSLRRLIAVWTCGTERLIARTCPTASSCCASPRAPSRPSRAHRRTATPA